MFKIPRPHSFPPTLDLGTVRETLAYMHDDMKRVPGLEKVAASLEATLAEIAAAEARVSGPVVRSITEARFFPRRG